MGSLREEIRPRDFVLPSQLIDRTKGIRAATFFDDGIVGHVGFADPFNADLAAKLAEVCATALPALRVHTDKTVVVMEGPAFSTRAESRLYRTWGADIINMTALPEAKLAREAEMGYAMVCMSTGRLGVCVCPGMCVALCALLCSCARYEQTPNLKYPTRTHPTPHTCTQTTTAGRRMSLRSRWRP